MNPTAEKLTGRSSEELLAKSWDKIFSTRKDRSPFDRDIKHLNHGASRRITTFLRTKDGLEKRFLWEFFRMEKGCRLKGAAFITVGMEIHPGGASGDEIHQEWELLTNIFNTVHAGLILLDRERRIIWANAQMMKWFGEKELLGMYCYTVVHEQKDSMAECPSFYTFKTGKTGSISKWVTTAGDCKRYFQFITTPMLGEGASVTHVLEMVLDMTDRKEAEERRVESERLATVAELAKAVAHEIRNPMTVIGGFARRLKKELPEGSPLRDTADVIVKESRRLEDMVLKVNLFLNPKEPHYTEGQLNELICQTVEAMRRDFEAASVTVGTRLDPNLPPIFVDSDKIRQVFFNMLQNAIEAMPGGGRVTIATELKEDFVEARIKDTGPGIREEEADALFHAFFSRKPSGLGLGLTIASQIINAHGGYIHLEKAAGERGALFVIGLPLISPFR